MGINEVFQNIVNNLIIGEKRIFQYFRFLKQYYYSGADTFIVFTTVIFNVCILTPYNFYWPLSGKKLTYCTELKIA